MKNRKEAGKIRNRVKDKIRTHELKEIQCQKKCQELITKKLKAKEKTREIGKKWKNFKSIRLEARRKITKSIKK